MSSRNAPPHKRPLGGFINGAAYIRGGRRGGGLVTGQKEVFQNKLHSSAEQTPFWISSLFLSFKTSGAGQGALITGCIFLFTGSLAHKWGGAYNRKFTVHRRSHCLTGCVAVSPGRATKNPVTIWPSGQRFGLVIQRSRVKGPQSLTTSWICSWSSCVPQPCW